MMPDQDSILLQLGREELLTLLSLMGIKSLAGLGDDYLGRYSDREQEILLTAGANALRAKGWIQESTNGNGINVQIDATLLAMIGACATAPRLLFLNYLPTDAPPRPWYVHLGEHLTIIHRTTLPGVHELWGSIDARAAAVEIGRLLQLEAANSISEPVRFSLAERDFDEAMKLLQAEGQHAAMDRLAAAGLTTEEGRMLITAISKAKANSTIALLAIKGNGDGAAPQTVTTFSFIISEIGVWRMDREETAVESRLVFSRISAGDAQTQLEAMLTKTSG